MNDDDFRKSKSLEILPLAEVSEILGYKDDKTTRKWLKKMGIQVHLLAKKSFVYQIELDYELDKPYVLDLKRKHPLKWKEKYKCVVKDPDLYNLMIFEVDHLTDFTPTTKVSVRNDSDKKLYNSLLL